MKYIFVNTFFTLFAEDFFPLNFQQTFWNGLMTKAKVPPHTFEPVLGSNSMMDVLQADTIHLELSHHEMQI